MSGGRKRGEGTLRKRDCCVRGLGAVQKRARACLETARLCVKLTASSKSNQITCNALTIVNQFTANSLKLAMKIH